TEYLNQWVPNTKMSEEQFIQRLEEVSVTDVQKIAQKIELQAVFFLDKELDHE
ncbi:insulinase family protein, partial [Escherichia coli]